MKMLENHRVLLITATPTLSSGGFQQIKHIANALDYTADECVCACKKEFQTGISLFETGKARNAKILKAETAW